MLQIQVMYMDFDCGTSPRSPFDQLYRPPPYDFSIFSHDFPVVSNDYQDLNDFSLAQELIVRSECLVASEAERTHTAALHNRVRLCLEKIIASPDLLPNIVIDEIVPVGAFKRGLQLAGNASSDIVVVLKTMPTVESVQQLGRKIVDELQNTEVLCSLVREFGVILRGDHAECRLLISTVAANAFQLEEDLHLSSNVMLSHMAEVRHTRWWDEVVGQTPVQLAALIRLLKSLRSKYSALTHLTEWDTEFTAYICMLHSSDRTMLSLPAAFKRFFQLIAAGAFLPGSPGLVDPTDPPRCIAPHLTMQQMDELCSCAQTLIRIICQGGWNVVLDTTTPDDTKTVTYANDVVITPLEKAFDPTSV